MTRKSRYFTGLILCACNCGEWISPLNKWNKPRIYKNGHQNRGRYKGKDNPKFKGIKRDKDGYWLTYKPDHPFAKSNGYVLLHRWIMEKHIGRYLRPEEVVHHKNGVPSDNLFSNLQLFDNQSKHVELENTKNFAGRVCSICGSDTTYTQKHNGRDNWFGNEKDGFMCSKCYMKKYNKTSR